MQFDVYTSADLPSELREDWNRLADGDPMSSWEWRASWWQVYAPGRRLSIAVARANDRVIGIAPCYTCDGPWRGRKLQWLGDGKVCTDYQRYLLDATLSPEKTAEACDGLVDALFGGTSLRRHQDLWELDGVQPATPFAAELERVLCARQFAIHAEPIESSWIIDLPADWATFKSQSHRTLRRKIAKAEVRSAEADVRFHTASPPDEISALWGEFVRLHELRFLTKLGTGGCFSDHNFAAFLPQAIAGLAARDAARLILCEVGGKSVSAQLYLLGNRTAYLYQSGFDPAAAQMQPGYLLYTRVLQDLIADGYQKLDFLRGDESYKNEWNAQSVPLVRVFCVPPRRTSQLRHQTYQLARSLKRAVKNHSARRSADRNASPKPGNTTMPGEAKTGDEA